jgi:hypothetical protein
MRNASLAQGKRPPRCHSNVSGCCSTQHSMQCQLSPVGSLTGRDSRMQSMQMLHGRHSQLGHEASKHISQEFRHSVSTR